MNHGVDPDQSAFIVPGKARHEAELTVDRTHYLLLHTTSQVSLWL